MEDLRSKQFKMWNKAELVPFENLHLAMRAIGKFHGISIAMKHQRPDEFAEFKQLTDFATEVLKSELFTGLFDASLDRAIATLKSEGHKNVMREVKENFVPLLKATLTDKSRFAVLSHGIFVFLD